MRWTLPLFLALMPLAPLHAEAPRDFTVVVMSGKSTATTSFGRSNGDEWRRAKAFQQGGQPLLYVRQDGANYLIRDAATIARADAILQPQRDLGARQGLLGAQQGRLGAQMAGADPRQMSRLGAEMRALGVRQGALGRQQSQLARQVRPQFEALVADAIRRGLARRVN